MIGMAIKFIISDIDGTILDDQHQLDDQLIGKIKLLKERDIPFVLASARSPKGMWPLAQALEIQDQPIACYNGALIMKENETLFSHELVQPEVSILVDILKNIFPQVSINLYSGESWYVDKIDSWVEIEAEISGDQPIEGNIQLLLLKKNIPIHKLLLIEKPEIINEVFEYLSNLNFPESDFYLSKDNYLEVTNHKVSKQKALLELANYYQVNLLNTMAIGDNFNDIPMLTQAGMGVAMDNAPETVKKSANQITANNNQNGVSQALQKYILTPIQKFA
ncbi:HAD family hydrolase [Enterococcus sp. AZ103]|uniref:HAD family hydrolase n=1 Tax=Enterococcus sp. AZ103 TaxID=2774628 RepID=UPI003F68789F